MSRTLPFGFMVMALSLWLTRRGDEVKAFVPLLRLGRTKRLGLRPKARPKARCTPRLAALSIEQPEAAALACGGVQDWLQRWCDRYRCMHVSRRQTWNEEEAQRHVDRIASAGGFGRGDALQEVLEVFGAAASAAMQPQLEAELSQKAAQRSVRDLVFSAGGFGGRVDTLQEVLEVAGAAAATTQPQLEAELSQKARRLVARAVSAGLPQSLGEQIRRDCEEVGAAVLQMLPAAEKVVIALELMGENSCRRWHQDHYVSRAIISYNGCGTEYTSHDNVNFWELEHCGNNDCILHDRSQVFSAAPGDILFMKGKLFPGSVNGLVHKSPEKRYHPDGTIVNRLLLKVDVPEIVSDGS